MMRKIGTTTATFKGFFSDLYVDTIEFIQWAKQAGFDWVEIRDSRLELSFDQLKSIKSVADDNGIILHYAYDCNNVFLHGNDEVVKNAIERTAIFGENTVCRTIIGTPAIFGKTRAIGYNFEQLEYVNKKLKQYDIIAKQNGIIIAYENSMERLFGNNECYGLSDLVDKTDGISIAYDMANAMNSKLCIGCATASDVGMFYQRYKKNIPYIHIKTSNNGFIGEKLLLDADVNLGKFLSFVDDNVWTCLELPASSNIQLTRGNVIDGQKILLNIV